MVRAWRCMALRALAKTGKTTRGRVEGFREEVDIKAKTHTASARAGGCTLDHYVRRHILHGALVTKAIWVEEFSQGETTLWAQLSKPEGLQFLLSGDFNQMPPFFDSWVGTPVHEAAFEGNSSFHYLAGSNRLTLTEGLRSDMQLFNFYSSLIAK